MKVWHSCVAALFSFACGAVFPEVSSPVKAPPPGREMLPPPPADLLFIGVAGAEIPSRTRDGRQWDSLGGSAPDPFVKFFVNDAEVFRTPIQSNTLKPTWPDQKRANYRIARGAKVRVELWDSNPLNNHTICRKQLYEIHEQAGPVPLDVDCESGAHLRVRVEPAHARWGLGFGYELRTGAAAVSRVLSESPASRAKLTRGDEIVEVQGKKVSLMEGGEVQSLINANAQIGLELLVRGADHAERKVSLKEGVIYPVLEEGVPVE